VAKETLYLSGWWAQLNITLNLYFNNRWEMFMTGTVTIHCSQRTVLPDVKLKMRNISEVTPNTMANHEKNSPVLCFQVVAGTIHGKMVPVQFQTDAQCFGDLSLLPLSRHDGGTDNL
jgi:hypothetical protein